MLVDDRAMCGQSEQQRSDGVKWYYKPPFEAVYLPES
jgi:hypothetical protein